MGVTAKKNQLMNTAVELFCENGYSDTSVNNITQAAGIAKGTFYHYFKTKEELLDEVIDAMTENWGEKAADVLEDDTQNPVEKLNALLDISRQWKFENCTFLKPLFHFMYEKGNILIRKKFYQKSFHRKIRLFSIILAMGVVDGSFSTQHPEYAAELILKLLTSLNDFIAVRIKDIHLSHVKADVNDKIFSYTEAVERIIGTLPGSVHLGTVEYIERFCRRDNDCS